MPAGWSLLPFKRLARIRDGQVDPTLPSIATLPLFAPNHIESGTGRLLSIETAAEQGALSGKYPVRNGEIAYSKIRPALRKAVIAPCDGLSSADMHSLRPMQGMEPRFLPGSCS
jgi:type I restriction enzyme S subunit